MANNIVVFNRAGVVALSGAGAPIIRNNCVYGNTDYDFLPGSAVPGTDGNISADPKFASTDYRDLHIQPDSPCIDAGDDSVLEPAWMDFDGQPRMQGAHVDIGADESDGTHWAEGPDKILRVTPTGNDANDGSAWDNGHAMKTIQCAVNAAFPWSGEVWVAAGEYRTGSTPSVFRMRDGVAVYGGFAGHERSREWRNWTANRTILPDGYVEIAACPSPATRVDGMVLQGCGAPSPQPIIWADDSASIVSNNTITGYNTFPELIRAEGATFDKIVGNTITGNTGSFMVICQYSPDAPPLPTPAPQSTAVIGNRIVENAAAGIWIRPIFQCAHVIADNVVGNNQREGMYLYSSNLTVTNNLVFGNGGAGIYFSEYASSGVAVVTNNTIVGNGFNPGRGTEGIYVPWCCAMTATNNIVAFNAVGIRSVKAATTLGNNNVFGNVNGNYTGFSTDPTGANGNISLDPLFRNAVVGDYHLLWSSPCIDAGTNVGAPPTDLDGNPRPIDGNIDGLAVTDIGAYEVAPLRVLVDVLPGDSTNRIQLQPNRMITVAILGTPEFDARSINPVSVLFGPGAAVEAHGRGHWEDANGDGRIDLILHFRCEETGIQPGDTTVSLSGRLVSGAPFTGSDTIVAVGTKSKGK
ncbi:MAG: right-handed parallel beta-helix repeat-containing protein [Armatimonadetes bacterium]|nr:right-handed parallel beta-helix repeat-containing protein [Armatimonadota bacterium]